MSSLYRIVAAFIAAICILAQVPLAWGKNCTTGCSCGNTCISCSETCHVGSGSYDDVDTTTVLLVVAGLLTVGIITAIVYKVNGVPGSTIAANASPNLELDSEDEIVMMLTPLISPNSLGLTFDLAF